MLAFCITQNLSVTRCSIMVFQQWSRLNILHRQKDFSKIVHKIMCKILNILNGVSNSRSLAVKPKSIFHFLDNLYLSKNMKRNT